MTAAPRVEFHFDFGSPNAYLAHLVVPEIERRTGVRFEYVPVLLGGVFKATGNVSPAVSLRGIRNKGEYTALETRRFLARHGITRYVWNPHFPVNTLQIMRGAVAAQRLGCFPRYRDEVYRHLWAEPKKLDDPEVIRAALLASGLPAEELLVRGRRSGREAGTDRKHRGFGGPGRVRLAEFLCRLGALLREGSPARSRRRDRSAEGAGRERARYRLDDFSCGLLGNGSDCAPSSPTQPKPSLPTGPTDENAR